MCRVWVFDECGKVLNREAVVDTERVLVAGGCKTQVTMAGCCRFRVLDECDEMLNMGFVEDVERILTAGGDIKTQTLLFSATLPSWVKDITRRFLEPTHKLVDLVGTDKMKVGAALPCTNTQDPWQ